MSCFPASLGSKNNGARCSARLLGDLTSVSRTAWCVFSIVLCTPTSKENLASCILHVVLHAHRHTHMHSALFPSAFDTTASYSRTPSCRTSVTQWPRWILRQIGSGGGRAGRPDKGPVRQHHGGRNGLQDGSPGTQIIVEGCRSRKHALHIRHGFDIPNAQ